ncbi:hypothetical protein XNC1_p0125 (plasmid) [Xenorhabdus nematophila ATCC 19061]|uniref:Uncharacterized protein n=1 Tax=Xenorhabdus nematophila (strain ATCC 19061 / DSM 3370 / CCUG 14189 / LMG 1036 / NCIMB 9965 / AN6) TaxID=406817 RepID=D3VM41_XENNA|nr:hypothetical protein XNC1_p0125 [Xenorhabdus nematophila ATCC 19061]
MNSFSLTIFYHYYKILFRGLKVPVFYKIYLLVLVTWIHHRIRTTICIISYIFIREKISFNLL